MQRCDLRESLREQTRSRLTMIKILIIVWLFTFLIGISLAFYYYPDYELFNQYISESGGLIPETNTPRYIFQITFFIQSILFLWLGYLLIVIKVGNNLFLGVLFITMSIGYICVAFPINIEGYIHGFGAWIIYIGLITIMGSLVYYSKDTESLYFYLFFAVFIIAFLCMVCVILDDFVFFSTFSLAKIFQKVYFIFAYITITLFFLVGIFDKVIITEQLPLQYRDQFLSDYDIDEHCSMYKDLLELD